MPSSADRNDSNPTPIWDPSAELLEKIPTLERAGFGFHPANLSAIVSRIDPKQHAVAAGAFATAIATQAQIYARAGVLGDSLATLQPFDLAGGTKSTPMAPDAVGRWNEQTERYRAHATKAHVAALTAHDAGELALSKISEGLESKISAKIKIPLQPHVEVELRAHVKANGVGALRQLIGDGDLSALSAVRSAPSFLSGLTDDQINDLAEHAATRHAPEMVLQRDVVRDLRDALDSSRAALQQQYSDGMRFAAPVFSHRPAGFSDQPQTKAPRQ